MFQNVNCDVITNTDSDKNSFIDENVYLQTRYIFQLGETKMDSCLKFYSYCSLVLILN